MKIFLVEDDIDLNETVKEFLENYYEVESVFDGVEAINKAYEKNFDIIILDVKLPKIDGFSVAKEIRKFKNTPIIFLTSLDSEKDVEKGFLSGGEVVKIGEFEFDLNNLELKKNGEIIHLKPKVAELLKFFIQNKNKVLSKEEIFNYLYDFEEPNEASLRTFINTLRHILGKDKIQTIKGVGYKFV